MNTERIPLHLPEPDETLYERCVWLALFAKDLKRRLTASLLEQQRLEDVVLGKEVVAAAAKELVALRRENEALVRENGKLAKECVRLRGKRTALHEEVLSLRGIHDHFQLPSAQA